MIKVGLTGSAGSNLTEIGKEFEKMGVKVFNADLQLKWILNYSDSIVKVVKENFGWSYVIGDFINPLAFDTDEKFNQLIDLAEYELFDYFNRFVKKNKGKAYVMFLSSLIFERTWLSKFDLNVNIFRPKADRIEEFRRVHDYDISYCHNIFENELDDLEKNKLSDFIIHDYLSEEQVKKQLINCDDFLVGYFLSENKESPRNKLQSGQLVKNIYA